VRVVDASALVTLVAGKDQATRDELGTTLTGHELHILAHTGAEVLSAIRGLRLGGKISEAIAIQALADYAAMPLRHHRAEPFFPRAWQLRHAMTAYDALYASLAETLDCPLVTCDEKLHSGGHRAEVIVVGARPRPGSSLGRGR
jgi:predicted nucleic acid-binding protein